MKKLMLMMSTLLLIAGSISAHGHGDYRGRGEYRENFERRGCGAPVRVVVVPPMPRYYDERGYDRHYRHHDRCDRHRGCERRYDDRDDYYRGGYR